MYIVGKHETNTLEQLMDVDTRADRTALMADGHLGYIMPIGGVAAYRNRISVAGVGFDIACGNCAIRTDLKIEEFGRQPWGELADEIQRTIAFGVGRKNEADDAPTDDPLFEDEAWDAIPETYARGSKIRGREWLRDLARAQLGTVGSGNHYVDVFVDEDEIIWVGVHFGSRGLGHTVATGFMNLVQDKPFGAGGAEVEALLKLGEPLGDAYWAMMNVAGRYAYLGREYVTNKVVRLLGGRADQMVHNHHNFAWAEFHDNEFFVVVRKGATPAFPGQLGFVGGSMGDASVILEGATDATAEPAQRKMMYSTVHGAGRVMGRMEAKGKYRKKTGEVIRAGKVTQEMMDEWLSRTDVILRGGGRDEAPQVYRRLPDVLAAQGNTINVLQTLRPLIVVMAGENPY